MVKTWGLIGICRMTGTAVPPWKLATVWIVGFVAAEAGTSPTGLTKKGMIEPVQSESGRGMAKVASLNLECAFMRIVLMVTD